MPLEKTIALKQDAQDPTYSKDEYRLSNISAATLLQILSKYDANMYAGVDSFGRESAVIQFSSNKPRKVSSVDAGDPNAHILQFSIDAHEIYKLVDFRKNEDLYAAESFGVTVEHYRDWLAASKSPIVVVLQHSVNRVEMIHICLALNRGFPKIQPFIILIMNTIVAFMKRKVVIESVLLGISCEPSLDGLLV